jgi:hypothetical protein
LPLNKYFIYKDSATGMLDSVVVKQSEVVYILIPAHRSIGLFDPDVPAYYIQKFTLLLTRNGTTSDDWFYGEAATLKMGFGAPQSTSDAPLALRERYRISNVDKIDKNHVFFYPVNPYSSVMPTITIEGKTYSNAIMTSIANGLEPTHQSYLKSIYYWVKGIGIIKREIRTSSSIKTELLIRNG